MWVWDSVASALVLLHSKLYERRRLPTQSCVSCSCVSPWTVFVCMLTQDWIQATWLYWDVPPRCSGREETGMWLASSWAFTVHTWWIEKKENTIQIINDNKTSYTIWNNFKLGIHTLSLSFSRTNRRRTAKGARNQRGDDTMKTHFRRAGNAP